MVGPPLAPGLLFAHVPKTGGTSLRRMLEAAWQGRPVLQAVSPGEFDARSDAELAAAELICGHYDVEQRLRLAAVSRRRWTVVSQLRLPAEQVASHYRYIRRTPEHPWHARFGERSLEAILEDPVLGPGMANYQSHYLQNFLLQRGLPMDLERLAAVAAGLDVMGTTERLGATYLVICWTCGRRPHSTLLRELRDPARDGPAGGSLQLSSVALEAIERLGQFDRPLHAIATARIESDATRLLATLGRPEFSPRALSEPATFRQVAGDLTAWQDRAARTD